MTAWLLERRSQTGHAGLVRELGNQIGHVLEHSANTGQDRDPPFCQLEKLAHGSVQKKARTKAGYQQLRVERA